MPVRVLLLGRVQGGGQERPREALQTTILTTTTTTILTGAATRSLQTTTLLLLRLLLLLLLYSQERPCEALQAHLCLDRERRHGVGAAIARCCCRNDR
jgi:hypothetical protein